MHRGLYAATIQRRLGGCRTPQATMPIRKQQRRVAMRLPKPAQQLQRRLRQRHKTIFVALRIANMDALTGCVDIADLKAQAFSQAESQAIQREKENLVTEHTRGGEYPLGFLDRDDVRPSAASWAA